MCRASVLSGLNALYNSSNTRILPYGSGNVNNIACFRTSATAHTIIHWIFLGSPYPEKLQACWARIGKCHFISSLTGELCGSANQYVNAGLQEECIHENQSSSDVRKLKNFKNSLFSLARRPPYGFKRERRTQLGYAKPLLSTLFW